MNALGSDEVGISLSLSCGGRAVTSNSSVRRSFTGTPDADGDRIDSLGHAEAGRAIGAGRPAHKPFGLNRPRDLW
jgi:hypothetical protein